MISDTPVLEARGLIKTFGHVEALRGASLAICAGEVVALVGDNGAGKSTLVSCLSGSQQPDAGEVLVDGREVRLPDPRAAHALGIETVYQDLALAPDLSVAANLFLGRELRMRGLLGRLGFVDAATERRNASVDLERLGIVLPSEATPVRSLSGGQRQVVAIARAVRYAQRVVFMDEPTAALGVRQTAAVLDIIRRVRDLGTAVVLISHNLSDVFAVADRIAVARLGAITLDVPTVDTTPDQIVAAITGADAA